MIAFLNIESRFNRPGSNVKRHPAYSLIAISGWDPETGTEMIAWSFQSRLGLI